MLYTALTLPEKKQNFFRKKKFVSYDFFAYFRLNFFFEIFCISIFYNYYSHCRHPDQSSRPTFIHLLKTLTRSPGQLLSWSHEDTWGVAEAIVLGAPLQAGKKLYPDLQDVYSRSAN